MSSVFQVPKVSWVTSRAEAEQIAIEWQTWQADEALSWGDLMWYEEYFTKLVKKFDLTETFKENGLI